MGRLRPGHRPQVDDCYRRISSLTPIPAKVCSPNRQPPLRLGGRNWSSCPISDMSVDPELQESRVSQFDPSPLAAA
jgi:hypothetical protein